ncbi:MAG: potassium-transporting ATPase subunit KdpC [Candidatus Omnitrophica bacterium]|nr:potassium-transporting ATPase subunit KdpC [Candidatus Omnitrophota bacterium]
MLKSLWKSLKILFVFSILTGIIYPFFMTLVGQILFPFEANGSILIVDGKSKGSVLIGQKFTKDFYFQGRPSVVDYDASASGASNFGPTSAKFKSAVIERIAVLQRNNPSLADKEIPGDLVLMSASGLDPDISLESAQLQAPRVALARKFAVKEVLELISSCAQGQQFGFLGSPRINVLKLNMALDSLKGINYGR